MLAVSLQGEKKSASHRDTKANKPAGLPQAQPATMPERRPKVLFVEFRRRWGDGVHAEGRGGANLAGLQHHKQCNWSFTWLKGVLAI